MLTPKDAPNGLFNHFGAFVKVTAGSVCTGGGACVKGSIPGKESTILLDVSTDIRCCPPNKE